MALYNARRVLLKKFRWSYEAMKFCWGDRGLPSLQSKPNDSRPSGVLCLKLHEEFLADVIVVKQLPHPHVTNVCHFEAIMNLHMNSLLRRVQIPRMNPF